MDKKKQAEYNVADLINDGSIINLADIDWKTETKGWNNETAKNIIDKIHDKTLKPAIIDAMLSEWSYNRDEWVTNIGFDMGFSTYLENLKSHIQKYDSFNIEAIRSRQTKEIREIKKDIELLKERIYLPKELNSDRAKSIISRAIKEGLCDNNYKWLKSKALLAYFADRASEYLKLGKGEYDGKIKTSWKPFETLFGISGLSGAKRDYQKTGTLPDGYKEVNNFFE